jgi:hypothetical protein
MQSHIFQSGNSQNSRQSIRALEATPVSHFILIPGGRLSLLCALKDPRNVTPAQHIKVDHNIVLNFLCAPENILILGLVHDSLLRLVIMRPNELIKVFIIV